MMPLKSSQLLVGVRIVRVDFRASTTCRLTRSSRRPQICLGRPHQPVREEGRIDQRLLVFREVHAIGRLRVGRVVEAFQYQFDVARPFPAFDGAVRAEFEPRGDPGQRAAERFEVAHVLRSVDLRFERHRRFQALFAQRGQYRQSRPVERGDPVFAAAGSAGCGVLRLPDKGEQNRQASSVAAFSRR